MSWNNKEKDVTGIYVTSSYYNRKMCLAAYNYNLLIIALIQYFLSLSENHWSVIPSFDPVRYSRLYGGESKIIRTIGTCFAVGCIAGWA